MDLVLEFLAGTWAVLGEMAPWLLFGFLVAGVLSVYVDPDWLERNLGGDGLGSIFKASLFGVPLPLCSCGVIPVAASLRAHGAGRPATAAFLLSTPQTGVDSILVTWSLLGPVFAVFRPLTALATGLLGGGLIRLAGPPEGRDATTDAKADTVACTDSCCDGPDGAAGGKIVRSLRYGLLVLPRDIGPALVIGVLIAGALGVLFRPDQLEVWIGGGLVSILLMMLAGVPVYVCATASVPIAAGLMHAGASPGAALAFLIAGPATNAAALTTVWKVLGRRSAILYLATVALSAVACGLILDWLMPLVADSVPVNDGAGHVHGGGGVATHFWALLLVAVLLSSRFRPIAVTEGAGSTEDESMTEEITLRISGMNCSHCQDSVRRALSECAGVERADVDLDGGRALISGRGVSMTDLVAAVDRLGFKALSAG